jgi:leucyl aminopeptidase
MDYKTKKGIPHSINTGCIVVSVSGSAKFFDAGKQLDQESQGYLGKLVKRGDLAQESGQTLLLHDVPGISAQRVLLAHSGKEALNDDQYIKWLKSCITVIKSAGAKDCLFYLDEVDVSKRDLGWKIKQAVLTFEDTYYSFTQCKSKANSKPDKLSKVFFALPDTTPTAEITSIIGQGIAIAKGMQLAKTLGNLPGNICTPAYLAEQGKQLGKQYKAITTRIIEEKEMKKLGMGALLSVSAGSEEPAKLIVMHYKGGKKDDAPQVLVGKGVTFDTGGISLKPGAAMDEMKFDMCGAASVFGTIAAIAEQDLPLNVIGIVAAAENMPGGKATRPGDIVTTMSGQTVEILNTDAEGRLVLCDALTYAEKFKPAAIIDIATLTGACVIALGHHATGLLANNDDLANELLAAGNEANDRAWQLPLWESYQPLLDSNFADMANIGGRSAGTITAACYLSRFTKKQRWAHLDIAGTAWFTGKEKGSTGRPVPLLCQYLMARAPKKD